MELFILHDPIVFHFCHFVTLVPCSWKKLKSKNCLVTMLLTAVLFVFVALFVTTNPTPRRIVRLVPRIPFCNCTLFTESPSDNPTVTNLSSEDTGSANSESLSSSSCVDVSSDFLNHHTLTRHSPHIDANCDRLFHSDRSELFRVRGHTLKWSNGVEDTDFFSQWTDKATATKLLTNNFYVSQKEKDFPLAFVLLFHYKPGIIQQYFRLLRFLYRPQNVFCIHIDAKAPEWWVSKINQFASFFPNILLAHNPVQVKYSTVSILDAHLKCFEELHESSLKWKYAINLHSTELPLVTNREIVETLEQTKGKNLISTGMRIKDLPTNSIDRQRVLFKCAWNGHTCKITSHPKRPPPFTFDLYKGADSANGAMTPDFVRFILTERRAKALRHFLEDVRSAVELFFNTLNQLPDAPGGSADPTQNHTLPPVTVRLWKSLHPQNMCTAQKFIHRVCITDVGDLPALKAASMEKKWMFYNKYTIDFDHVVMDCIENLLVHRNKQEYTHDCH